MPTASMFEWIDVLARTFCERQSQVEMGPYVFVVWTYSQSVVSVLTTHTKNIANEIEDHEYHFISMSNLWNYTETIH